MHNIISSYVSSSQQAPSECVFTSADVMGDNSTQKNRQSNCFIPLRNNRFCGIGANCWVMNVVIIVRLISLIEDLTLLILTFYCNFVTKMVYSVVEIFFSPGAVKWGGGGGWQTTVLEFGDTLGIPVSVQNACYMSARCAL